MEVSSLTLNRLSVYLRCLRRLQEEGSETTSSRELAERFHLSASLIRKDLTQFGEFGIRGVGYRVGPLIDRLIAVLGIDQEHRLIVVGVGGLGSALIRHLGLQHDSFRVVGGVDVDPAIVGTHVGPIVVRHADELEQVVSEAGADVGLLTVPAKVAQDNYDALVASGIRAVLNFAPVRLDRGKRDIPTRSVDVRIILEELSFRVKG